LKSHIVSISLSLLLLLCVSSFVPTVSASSNSRGFPQVWFFVWGGSTSAPTESPGVQVTVYTNLTGTWAPAQPGQLSLIWGTPSCILFVFCHLTPFTTSTPVTPFDSANPNCAVLNPQTTDCGGANIGFLFHPCIFLCNPNSVLHTFFYFKFTFGVTTLTWPSGISPNEYITANCPSVPLASFASSAGEFVASLPTIVNCFNPSGINPYPVGSALFPPPKI
jgi:hypothetical protein